MSADIFCNKCVNLRKSNIRGYCPECCKLHQNDVIELIMWDDDMKNVKSTIYNNVNDSENVLKELSADIRYDLHGVLDTVDNKTILSHRKSCVISFVGLYSTTRTGARLDTIKRIHTKQIDFGILVFKRGNKKSTNYNKFTNPGSKAWVNSLLKYENKCLFIDDGFDHYLSTKFMNIPNLTCVMKTEETNLQDIVNLFLENLSIEYVDKIFNEIVNKN